jgi:hypothetical protein
MTKDSTMIKESTMRENRQRERFDNDERVDNAGDSTTNLEGPEPNVSQSFRGFVFIYQVSHIDKLSTLTALPPKAALAPLLSLPKAPLIPFSFVSTLAHFSSSSSGGKNG